MNDETTPPCARGYDDATLAALHDGELPADQARAVSDHVPDCPACQARLAAFEQTGDLLRGQREPELRQRVWRGLQARIVGQRPRPAVRRGVLFGGGAATAAAVLLVALLAHLLTSGAGHGTTSGVAPTATPGATVAPATATPTASGTATAIPTPALGAPDNATVYRLMMVDALHGWAQTCANLVHTSDGGRTWQVATPPGMVVTDPNFCFGFAALNAQTVWVGYGATVWRTTDGGTIWKTATLARPAKQVAQFDFVDAQHGWLVDFLGYAASHSYFNLYRTTDGGATWKLVQAVGDNPPSSLPSGGDKSGVAFINATTGWVSGEIPAPNVIYFYVTHDGGVTWQLQLMPAPIKGTFYSSTGQVQVFDARDAQVTVNATLNGTATGATYLYATHDGGQSWSLRGEVQPNSVAGTVLNQSFGFGLDGNGAEYTTADGGLSWHPLGKTAPFPTFANLGFVSPQYGWASSSGASDGPLLWRTTDGGLTWTKLSGTLGG